MVVNSSVLLDGWRWRGFCDRAIFLEKGQVRFSGPADELLERGDLVRAVFLGTDGG